MKHYGLYLPMIAVVVLGALWLKDSTRETTALKAAIATRRAELATQPTSPARADAVAESEEMALAAKNASLRAELQRIEEATSATHREIASLETRIPPSLETEITESFGRVTDMGAEFGQYARLASGGVKEIQKELKRRGLDKDSDLGEILVGSFMKLATWAPEIAAMEDTPAEIASLQSEALRETFSLTDEQTKQAEAIIEAHFATMKTAGLTHSSHDAPEWRERRSASLTDLLWKLRPLIPADSKLTSNLTQIVNLGAGMETKTIPPAPGTTEKQTVQGFANWPAVPWLL